MVHWPLPDLLILYSNNMADNLKIYGLALASWWAYIDNINVVLNLIIAVLSIIYTLTKIFDWVKGRERGKQ